jgi:hypothetical protein
MPKTTLLQLGGGGGRHIGYLFVCVCQRETLFWCGYGKYSILHKGSGSKLTICTCYLWHNAASVCLDTSFHYMQYWKGIWEKEWEVNGVKAHITIYEAASNWILSRITLVCGLIKTIHHWVHMSFSMKVTGLLRLTLYQISVCKFLLQYCNSVLKFNGFLFLFT